MVFIQKWSVTLLLLLLVCMAYSPTMAAITCFFLGLTLHIQQPTRFNFDKNKLYKLSLAVIGLLLIGILASVDPAQSLKTFGRMLPAALAVYGALHLLRSSMISAHPTTVIPRNSQQGYDVTLRNPIQLLSLFMVMYVIVVHLCAYLFDFYQLRNWAISNQNKLTTLMLMLVCVQSAVWVVHRRVWHIFLAAALCASTLFIEGRGAFITGMLVLCVAFMLRYRLLEKRRLLLVSLSSFAGLGILCLWLLIQMRGGFAHFSLNQFLSGRIELWQAAIEVFVHHPWFGIGFGTWQKSEWVNSLIPVFKNQPSPHNVVLDLLSSVGVIGTIFFVGMVKFYIDFIRKIPLTLSPLYRYIGLLVLAANLVNGLIDFRLFATQFLGISAVALILWQGGRYQDLSTAGLTGLK